MGRSEFAPPPAKIVLDDNTKNIVAVPCLPPSSGCTCHLSYSDRRALAEKSSEEPLFLRGRVLLSADILKEKPGTPDLKIKFIGREHVDVYSKDGAKDITHEIYKHELVLPWVPFAEGEKEKAYAFSMPVPKWLPPSATPSWGAIDYRLHAHFSVPDGHEEVYSQKRIEVARTHASLSQLAAGPLVKEEFDLGPSNAFHIIFEAPREAYTDIGNIKVKCSVSLKENIVNMLKEVKISLFEIREYTYDIVTVHGERIQTEPKHEKLCLGEQKINISSGNATVELRYGNTPGTDGVPILMHPALKGYNMKIEHEVGITLVYTPKPGTQPPKPFSLKNIFGGASDERVFAGSKIKMVTGLVS